VLDASGQKLAYVMRRIAASIAANIAKLPNLLGK